MATRLNKDSVILCTALHGTHDCSWSVHGICLGCIADMFEDDEFSVVNQCYLSNSWLYKEQGHLCPWRTMLKVLKAYNCFQGVHLLRLQAGA